MHLLFMKRRVWFVPNPHPPPTIPAVPVLLLLTIHEVVQASKVRRTWMIPAIEWWLCLQFMLEVTSRIFYGPIMVVVLIIQGQVLPQILDSIWVGMSEPLYRDSIGKKTIHNVLLPKIGQQCRRRMNSCEGYLVHRCRQQITWTVELFSLSNCLDIRSGYCHQVCKLTRNHRPSFSKSCGGGSNGSY